MLKALSSSLETVLKSQATHARMGQTLANRLTQRWAKNFARRILPNHYDWNFAHDGGVILDVQPFNVSVEIDSESVQDSSLQDIEDSLYLQYSVEEDTVLVNYLTYEPGSNRHSLSDAYEVTPQEAMWVAYENMRDKRSVEGAEYTVSPDVYFAIRQNCKDFKPALTIGHNGYVGTWGGQNGAEAHRIYTDAMRPRAHRVLDSGTIIFSTQSEKNQMLTLKTPLLSVSASEDNMSRTWDFSAPRCLSIDPSSIITVRIYTNDRDDG